MIGDDHPEHGVAEELQTLVRLGTLVLRTPGTMRDGQNEKLRPFEAVAESLAQTVEIGVGVRGDQDPWPTRPCT
jgi:hypothetical protein